MGNNAVLLPKNGNYVIFGELGSQIGTYWPMRCTCRDGLDHEIHPRLGVRK